VIENEHAVRLSAEGVQKSSTALASLTGMMDGLSLDKPGTRLAAIVVIAGVVAIYALLFGLVVTMVGIRRSLRRIETAMGAGSEGAAGRAGQSDKSQVSEVK